MRTEELLASCSPCTSLHGSLCPVGTRCQSPGGCCEFLQPLGPFEATQTDRALPCPSEQPGLLEFWHWHVQ